MEAPRIPPSATMASQPPTPSGAFFGSCTDGSVMVPTLLPCSPIWEQMLTVSRRFLGIFVRLPLASGNCYNFQGQGTDPATARFAGDVARLQFPQFRWPITNARKQRRAKTR